MVCGTRADRVFLELMSSACMVKMHGTYTLCYRPEACGAKKSLRRIEGNIYMDGLVSTGNKFPSTILKLVSSNTKKSFNYFIHILNYHVDKNINAYQ